MTPRRWPAHRPSDRHGHLQALQRQPLRHAGRRPDPALEHGHVLDAARLEAYTFNTAGTFYFVATYSGDNNNIGPVNSGCTAEPLVVGPKAPAVSTVISPAGPIALGTQAHDTSTLTGAFNPTGTVTYKLYSDNNCGRSSPT